MTRKRPISEQPTVPMFPLPAPPRGTAVSEAPTEVWIRPPEPQRRPNWLLRIVVGGVVLVFLLLGTVFLVGSILIYESSWIFPGTSVLGQDLGGQTKAEAAAALQDYWQSRQVTLAAGDASWQVPPETLGVRLDVGATIEAAHAQGRSWESMQQAWRRGGQFLAFPVWELDVNAARANLTGLAPELTVPPVDAGMTLVNGRFVATPAQPGETLDLEATLQALQEQAAAAVLNGRFELATKVVPAAVTDVSDVVAEANNLLDTTVRVTAYDPISDDTWTWTLEPNVWGEWLTVDTSPVAQGQFSWSLDAGQVGSHLNGQVAALGGNRYVDEALAGTAVSQAIADGSGALRLRVYHHPQQHAVQPGETMASIGRDYGIPYPWIQQANPGVENLFVGQTLTIPSLDDLLPLPVVDGKRIVVSITQQKVWVYENDGLMWEWAASTGIDDSPTSPGVFQIRTHEENAYAGNWNLWMPYFMGIYQPVPTSEFMNGFHGFPTRSGSQLLWTGSLGRKVTYGCILVSTENALQLYNWAESGVIVEIQP